MCFDGYQCLGGSTAPDAVECDAGYACVAGVRSVCPPGWYSLAAAVTCTPCQNDTYSASAAATSADQCLPCPLYAGALIQEGSGAGSADCWPGLLSAIASNPYPVVVGFSIGDVVTFTFTKAATGPPSPVLFSPGVGTVAFSWRVANSQLVARMVDAGGTAHPVNPASVEIGLLAFILSGVASASSPSSVTPSHTLLVSGTWGDPLPPNLVNAAAVNSGGDVGFGDGDSVGNSNYDL